MKTLLKLAMVPVVFAASSVLAADGDDGMKVFGSIGLDAVWTSTETRDAAKLNEYRDLDSGATGHFDLKGRGGEYYFDAFGENLNRDDQYLNFRGGKYTIYKYQLYDNRLVHNWAFGALTPYAGVGTSALLGTFPQTGTATWNQFDFGLKREDVGGMVEVSNNSPWYVRVDANQVMDTGLRVIGGANGTSPGNGFIEKPAPIDYKTQDVSVEGGYATKTRQLSVSALYSKFTNDNQLLRWTNPFFGSQQDTSTLAIDSDYIRFGVNGALKQLPLGSTLAGRVTYSTTLSNLPVQDTALNTGGVYSSTYPSVPAFDGDVRHVTASLSLYSNPTRVIDTRIYLNYFKKENDSTHVDFLVGTNSVSGLTCGRIVLGATVIDPGDCATETLSYRKSNLGMDAGFRITPDNRLVVGYDYMDLRRERVDYNETEDHKASIEFRNTSLDFLTARLKYQYLARHSNFLEGDAAAGDVYGAANNPEYLNRYIARFDAANMDQNLVRLVFDFTPIEYLDASLEAIYKKNDYGDTVLGRRKDDRHQAYFSVAYGDIRKFRVMLFGDVEHVERNSYHRAIGTVSSGAGAAPNDLPSGYCQSTAPNCYDPYGAPTSANYNWDAMTHDRNWSLGLGADWMVVTRLKLSASIVTAATNGNEDITVQPGATPTTPAVPISNFDDTKKLAINLKGTFQAAKAWEIVGGYSYERYQFADISYDGYRYIIPGGTSSSYLTGIYAFPDYKVHIVYVTTTFRF